MRESNNPGQQNEDNRIDYISSILKSRDLMYRNRDIVNGQEASMTILSKDYLLEKLNGINIDSSNFNKNQVDNTEHHTFCCYR